MRNSIFLLCARLFALLIEKQSKEKRKRQILFALIKKQKICFVWIMAVSKVSKVFCKMFFSGWKQYQKYQKSFQRTFDTFDTLLTGTFPTFFCQKKYLKFSLISNFRGSNKWFYFVRRSGFQELRDNRNLQELPDRV